MARVNISIIVTDPINVMFVLNCTSVGGPVSQMIWMVNGSADDSSSSFPILSDAVNGRYHNTLIVYGRKVGNYSCYITDGNGLIINKQFHLVTG